MRSKAGINIVYFSALCIFLCAASGLQAQTAPAMEPAAQAGASLQDSANELSVAVGKMVLVDTAQPISRVALGLADVAEAQPINPTEVMVTGKVAGETSLIIWDIKGGRQFFNITVRAGTTALDDSLEGIRRELKSELPGQTLRVSADNGMIFLRGTVKTINNSNRAEKIASTGGKVVNLLNVEVPPADPQILLKVRFESVDRTKETQAGINLFSTGFGNTIGAVTTGQFSPPGISLPAAGTASSATIANQLNLFAFLPGLNLGATLEALETRELAEVLAQPNIIAANGKEASFLAGGEYPYPEVQGSASAVGGAVTIQFKEYGVRLNFIPTVTPRGTIRLQVAPEVSTLDFTNGIEISGFDVPGIDTRRVNTEVELADGQSFAIGGLLNNTDNETFQKIPFLGDIPILGKFFQSIQKTKVNTELIVIVTPEIVAPMEVGAALPEPKYPGKFLPPNSGIPMNNPDAKNAANTPEPSPATLPIEKLIDSMRPERPLIIEQGSGSFGQGSTMSTAPASTAPPQ
ncbi:MAG: pilus assembly protein N-terminal domain-containing protein [Terracidiphilus sp.]